MYLMSPELFNQLSCVRGFNNLNGQTYPDHVILILSEILTSSQKDEVKKCENEQDVLDYLKNQMIEVTHNFE
jgi:hypothetical protein